MTGRTGYQLAAAAGGLALLAGLASGVPVRAASDVLYAGQTDGAGMPLRPDVSADPGGHTGSAALSARAEKLDPKIVYGGVQVSDALAVEAVQKRSFGEPSKTAEESFGLAGRAKLPLTDALSFTGKVGVQVPGSTLGSGAPGLGEPSGPSPVYGFGLAYEAVQGLELRVESEHVATRSGEPRAAGDSVLLGARLRF